jgi:hypothetical protein
MAVDRCREDGPSPGSSRARRPRSRSGRRDTPGGVHVPTYRAGRRGMCGGSRAVPHRGIRAVDDVPSSPAGRSPGGGGTGVFLGTCDLRRRRPCVVPWPKAARGGRSIAGRAHGGICLDPTAQRSASSRLRRGSAAVLRCGAAWFRDCYAAGAAHARQTPQVASVSYGHVSTRPDASALTLRKLRLIAARPPEAGVGKGMTCRDDGSPVVPARIEPPIVLQLAGDSLIARSWSGEALDQGAQHRVRDF